MMKSRLPYLIIVFVAHSSFTEPHVYPSGILFPSTLVPSVQRTSPNIWVTPNSEQSTLPLEKTSTMVTHPEKINYKTRTIPPMHLFRPTISRSDLSNLKNIANFNRSSIAQVQSIANLGNINWQSNKTTILYSNKSQSEEKNIFSSERTNKPILNDDSKQNLKTTVFRSFPVNFFQGLKQNTTNATSNRKQNSRKTLSKIVLKKSLHTSGKSVNENNFISSDLLDVNRLNSSGSKSMEVHGITHPGLLSELRETIRHQRQIRFKSSYQDLPVSLLAAANDKIGQKLNKDVSYFIQVDVEAPAVAKALATLPEGAKTYFPPQASDPGPITNIHFNSTAIQMDDNNIASKYFKLQPYPSSQAQNLTTITKGIKLASKISLSNLDKLFNIPNISFIPLTSHSSSRPTQNHSVTLTQTPPTWLTPPERSNTSIDHFNKSLTHLVVNPSSHQSYTIKTKHSNKTSSYSVVTNASSQFFKSSSSPPTYVTSPPSNTSKKSFITSIPPNRITSPRTHSLRKSKPVSQNNEVYTLAPLSLQFVKSSAGLGNIKQLDTQSNNKKTGFNSFPSFLKSHNNSIARHRQFMATIKPILNVQRFSHPNYARFQPSRFSTKQGDKDFASQFQINDGKTRTPSNLKRTNGSLSGPIPGKAGIDYPTYQTIPKTNFDCSSKPYEGYFADQETGCQAFHVCWGRDRRRASFLCPVGTLFSQRYLVCDWWNHVNCNMTKEIEEAGSSPWDAQGNPRPRANAI